MKLYIYSLKFSVLLPATLIVPTDYPNIQAGFDAPCDGRGLNSMQLFHYENSLDNISLNFCNFHFHILG